MRQYPKFMFLFICMVACTTPKLDQQNTNGGPLDFPQDLIFVGDRLVVGSTGYDSVSWRSGSLIVFDVPSLQRLQAHRVTHKNPQRLLLNGDELLVLNTGTYDFSDFEEPKAATNGGIDTIPLDRLLEPDGLKTVATFERNDFPAPVDMDLDADGHLWITSGLKPVVSLQTGDAEWVQLELSETVEISLASVKRWRNNMIVVNFNTDKAHFYSHAKEYQCSIDLGDFPDEMEGASAPVVFGDSLYYLLTLSGVVKRLPLSTNQLCDGQPQTVVSPLGQVPNALTVNQEGIFVVHSADNNLIQYDHDTGAELNRYAFPLGSNPWAMAFSDDGQYIAVSEWALHQVSLINRRTDEITRLQVQPDE